MIPYNRIIIPFDVVTEIKSGSLAVIIILAGKYILRLELLGSNPIELNGTFFLVDTDMLIIFIKPVVFKSS